MAQITINYRQQELTAASLTVEEQGDPGTKKRFSQPPLNLLFNPSLIDKQDVWKIDVVNLLEMLLNLLTTSGNRDLRVCGFAILTSALIHRLKVESIFRLDKIANQKEDIVKNKNTEERVPIPELAMISFPFRKETFYPATLEDLLSILENMITGLAKPVVQKSLIELKPAETFDFQQYFIKFEKVIEEYESKLYDKILTEGEMVFNEFVATMNELEIARYFIAMLYLAMRGKIDISHENNNENYKSGSYMSSFPDSSDCEIEYNKNGIGLIKITVFRN